MKTNLLNQITMLGANSRRWIVGILALSLTLLSNGAWGQTTKSNTITLDAKTLSSSQHIVRNATKATESLNQSDFEKELWKNEPFGERDGSRELLDKRDAFSKHFQNDNGTVTAHIASGPIHYQENGQWKTIYHTIEPSANGGFQNTYNSFRTYYPATASGEIVTVLPDGTEMRDMQGMRMYYEVNGQEVGTMNIANTPVSVDFNKLTYSGVYGSQIDLRLTQNSTQRKMDYMLQSASALNGAPQNAQYLVFEEQIILPQGVTAKLVENKIILSNAKGEVIAEYTNPDIYDEQPAETEDENYLHRSEATYQIEQNGNLLTIKTKVQMTWLLDVNRNFPVVVDPTVNIEVPYADWACAFGLQRPSDGACGNITNSTSFFDVGRGADQGGAIYFDGYNRFDVTSIPAGSTVNSSQVFFTMYSRTSQTNGMGTVTLSRMDYNVNSNNCVNFYSNITSTAYSGNFSSTVTSNAVGAHNLTLNTTGVADLQGKVGNSFFALAYRPTGTYSSASRFRRIAGWMPVNCPYIVVDYTLAPPPANDNCANAQSITIQCPASATVISGTTANATEEAMADPSCDSGTIRDVWYTFNSGPNTSVDLSVTLGTASWLGGEVHTTCGSPAPGLTIGGNAGNCDFYLLNPSPTVISGLIPNTTYRLRLFTNVDYDVAGTFTFTLTNSENNPGAVSVPATICAGTPASITNVTAATGGPNNVNYYFYYRGGPSNVGWQMYDGPTTNTSSSLPSAVINTPGTWFIARNSDFGCGQANNATTLDLQLIVNAAPTANAGGALSAICQGSTSAAMGGSVGGGATGGTWSGGTGTWTNANNPSTATYTAGASESGTITLTLTTSGGSCGTTTATKTITINQNPTAPTSISGTTTICSGQSTTLTAAGGSNGSGAIYQWGTGTVGSNIIAGQTSVTLTVSPTVTTTYWVRRIGNTSCTSATGGVTVAVTVNTAPTAPTSITGISTICSGQSTTLTAAGGSNGSGATFQWGTGTVGSNILAGQTASTLTVSPTTTTTYWVRRIGNTSCTSATGGVTVTVTVNAAPTAPTSITGISTICIGQSTTLTATGGDNGSGATFEWGTGAVGSNIIAGQTSSMLTVSPTSTTTYWVRRIGNTACSNTTSGVTTTITVNNPTLAAPPANGDMVWRGASSNDWATLPNWWQYNGTSYAAASAAPTSAQNVIIPANQTCVVNQPNTNANTGSAKNLRIENGATLTMGSGSLTVAENWVNNGSFVPGTGTVTFAGSGTHTMQRSVRLLLISWLEKVFGITSEELIAFTAQCQNEDVEVNWSTATEHNSQYFMLQVSEDGYSWSDLYVIEAAEFSTTVLEYSYIHKNAARTKNYYRLRQYDNDGTVETYNTIMSNCTSDENVFMTFPNPSADAFTVLVNDKLLSGSNVLNISDASGKLIYSIAVDLENGSGSFALEGLDLPAGLYYLQLNNGSYASRIIKHSFR
jgi:hypothetical protein